MALMRPTVRAAAAAALVVPVLACSGGSGGISDEEATRGGTLFYLTGLTAESLDPQRMYLGRDISNLNRIVYRGLVTFPVTEDSALAATVVPDVATDTGTMSEDAKTWHFTIRAGVTWQDGKPVTCEDFKYGISRTFATDVITGGPNYILSFIDIPESDNGLPIYNGPYRGDHQDAYDRAVTCNGSELTLRFRTPWPDFNLAAASLRAFDPYREDQDQGERSSFHVFSNGPYKMAGSWDPLVGATFVRNQEYDPASDESDTRAANPDTIVYTQGLENGVIYDRLIADAGDDQLAVTDRSVPPAAFPEITGRVADRATLVDSPYVHYLVPNFNRLKNLDVRRALMLSADVTSWITATGGAKVAAPAHSLVHPTVLGYRDNANFTAPPEGDPEAARALLERSGEKLPYPLVFIYPAGSPVADKAAAALAEGWKKAGFEVRLDPQMDNYTALTSRPSTNFDVTWGGWGADWPSIATVLPPLFDSRINLTENSNGQDVGNYRSDTVNALIDEAALLTDLDGQSAKYAEIDDQLGRDVAYIPLDIAHNYFLRGSRVTGYVNNPATSGLPDLGAIGVEH